LFYAREASPDLEFLGLFWFRRGLWDGRWDFLVGMMALGLLFGLFVYEIHYGNINGYGLGFFSFFIAMFCFSLSEGVASFSELIVRFYIILVTIQVRASPCPFSWR